jgi:hypothetical protein
MSIKIVPISQVSLSRANSYLITVLSLQVRTTLMLLPVSWCANDKPPAPTLVATCKLRTPPLGPQESCDLSCNPFRFCSHKFAGQDFEEVGGSGEQKGVRKWHNRNNENKRKGESKVTHLIRTRFSTFCRMSSYVSCQCVWSTAGNHSVLTYSYTRHFALLTSVPCMSFWDYDI